MKVTGIMPCYNLISGQYPFVECLLLALPLVDEFVVNDGGSTDGTLEVLKRISEINPKFRIIETLHKKGKHWESIDEGVELCIREATGDWIIEIQADEYYHPNDYQKIKSLIDHCNRYGYNSIRQNSVSVSQLSVCDSYLYKNMRIIRNTPNIRSHDGGDSFCINGQPHVREGFSSHNMPPELDSDLKMYNLSDSFEISMIVRPYRHYKFYAEGTKDRESGYDYGKARFNLESDDFDPDVIVSRSLRELIPNIKIDSEVVPEIFHDLVNYPRYFVRKELFELFKE